MLKPSYCDIKNKLQDSDIAIVALTHLEQLFSSD